MVAVNSSLSATTATAFRYPCYALQVENAVLLSTRLLSRRLGRHLYTVRCLALIGRGSNCFMATKIRQAHETLWSVALLTRTGRCLDFVCTASVINANRLPSGVYIVVSQVPINTYCIHVGFA